MSGPLNLGRVRSALAQTEILEVPKPRRAAIALVLASNAGPRSPLSLLMVRRAEREGDPWSGHMALPGGHAQSEDASLAGTARRETREEVGIDLGGAELLGRLDDVSPLRSSDLVVSPFVFWTGDPPALRLSPEIAEALWIPLEMLAGDSLRDWCEVDLHGARRRVPAFVIEGRVVWGMTFQVLDHFLTRMRAGA